MTISIITHPGNKHPRIETDLTGAVHVYVREPALEGRANHAVIRALADHFGIRKNAVTILSGHTHKHKRVEIIGADEKKVPKEA